MKTIIRIDWVCQTIMVGGIFVMLVIDELRTTWVFGNLLVWQVISAIILLVMNHGRGPRRIVFLAGVFGYWLSIIISSLTGYAWLKAVLEIVVIGLPVALIICYWLLTTCNLYPTVKYHKGKFLPHTSF